MRKIGKRSAAARRKRTVAPARLDPGNTKNNTQIKKLDFNILKESPREICIIA